MQQIDQVRTQVWQRRFTRRMPRGRDAVRVALVNLVIGSAFLITGVLNSTYALTALGGLIIFAGLFIGINGVIFSSEPAVLSASEVRPWEFERAPFARDGSLPGPSWQPDPLDDFGFRWWDGQAWTAEARQRLG
jgi:hypothetical protein